MEDQVQKKKRKLKLDTQDRVVLTQFGLSVGVMAAVLIFAFVFPVAFGELEEQYTAFVTKPPVWDLDGAQPAWSTLWEQVKDLFGNA